MLSIEFDATFAYSSHGLDYQMEARLQRFLIDVITKMPSTTQVIK